MDEIEAARALIDAAERITVLTGAGISTDSGIQDFRGPQGLWTKNPEAEKMATIQHYMGDPEVRRRSWQMKLAGAAQQRDPNAGHRALVDLETQGKLETLITQNVDGLHQAAGSSPDRIVEIHGTLHEVVCMDCGERAPMERALARVRAGEEDPPCRSCGGILKSAGTTLAVYPIAGVVPIAKQNEARVIILNAEPTEMDGLADVLLRGSISEILPQIVGAP
jgi:NAD-dependent deacetylase